MKGSLLLYYGHGHGTSTLTRSETKFLQARSREAQHSRGGNSTPPSPLPIRQSRFLLQHPNQPEYHSQTIHAVDDRLCTLFCCLCVIIHELLFILSTRHEREKCFLVV